MDTILVALIIGVAGPTIVGIILSISNRRNHPGNPNNLKGAIKGLEDAIRHLEGDNDRHHQEVMSRLNTICDRLAGVAAMFGRVARGDT